ncbi:MAG: hypothetical protein R2707_20585 [Acidimicrobiales bacterium]
MSSHRLAANGIEVVVRDGWEVEFSELRVNPGATPRSLVHLANFALPAERGDYGSGAVETMDSGGILVVLMEFDSGSARTAMFTDAVLPLALAADDFSPQSLQRRLAGQSGAQRFFRTGARAFGLYVVLGSHRQAGLLVREVNLSLAGVSFG